MRRRAVRADRHDAGVVAGGDGVEAEQRRARAQEAIELEVAVALDARVRGEPGGVVGDVGPDHVGGEVVAEVEDEVLDAELVGDPAGVVDVAHRAAPRVGVAAPELEGDADDLVALVGSMAAATEESTPPDMATSTCTAAADLRGRRRAGARRRAAPRRGRGRPRPRWWTTRATGAASPPRSSGGTPIAASTCEVSMAPLEHDEAADA